MQNSPIQIPSKAQTAAIDSDAKKIIVVAGPGSGKTSTTVNRICRLIRQGCPPWEIVAITFTNAAADEMSKRIAATLGDNIKLRYIGTLHGFMLQLIQERALSLGFGVGVSVVSEEHSTRILNEVIRDHRWKGSIETVKTELQNGPYREGRTPLELLRLAYYSRMRKAGLIDFDAILHYGLHAVKSKFCKPFKHLFVDEFQDSSHTDACIYHYLPAENRFFVGDIDQCQPADTKVSMSDGSLKAICQIKSGDMVVSYARHEKCLLKAAKVTAIKERFYNGNLHTVSAGELTSRCTPNHKWLIRWSTAGQRSINLWCVYLMRKGDKFRVGKTKFFRSSGNSRGGYVIGIGLRLKQEGADCGWVLSVHDSDADAIVNEQIIAATYGLPQVTFVTANNTRHLTQELLNSVFDKVPNQMQNAVRCLKNFGRELELPLIDMRAKRTRRTVQEIHACNLISGVMQVPVAGSGYDSKNRKCSWIPIQVSHAQWAGNVYSLDVEKYHKYVSNGIVTCNSIYAFRGGNPKLMLGMLESEDWQKFCLQSNFRSDKLICAAANTLIRHNKERFPKLSVAESEANGSVNIKALNNPAVEMAWIGSQIAAMQQADDAAYRLKNTAVLTRTNSIRIEIANHLEAVGIPINRKTERQWPKSWRTCRALLEALTNPDNDELIYNYLLQTLSEREAKTLQLKAFNQMKSLNELTLQLAARINTSNVIDVLHWKRVDPESIAIVREAVENMKTEAPINELLLYMASDEGSEAKQTEGVTVSTIHGAKGLEFDTVFLPAFEQGILPSLKADIEEERRLAFVGITRARHHLHITYCTRRKKAFSNNDEANPSQFLAELNS